MEIQRRIVTFFEAKGASQVEASLATMRGGFGQLRREWDVGARSAGAVDKQLKALGTTMRYMVAGSAVYSTIQMVQNLGQFQAMLGEISSIATNGQGLPIVGNQLDQLGNKLLDISNRTTQPINDLEQGVISLYSTLDNVPPDKAAQMMDTISKVAITTQSNVNDTTNALLSMIDAFGQSTDAAKKYGNEMYTVIAESANMTGLQFSNKLGVLSSSAALSSFSPEQMNALAIGATRFGGTGETNMTYLAQMMLYLMHPRTSKAAKALAGIGLGPSQRQSLGGWGTLMKLLQTVNERGGVGMSKTLAGASDQTLTTIDQMGLTGKDAGITGGGSSLISEVFGRIQSERMAAILSQLVTPDQVAGTQNKTLDQYLQDVSRQADQTDKAMERAMDYRRIQQAGNAMHNLGIEMGTALSPIFQYPSQGITWASSAFNSQNPWAQRGILAGGIGGTALLLRSLSRGGAGASRALGGVGLVGAALDAANGGTVRGDSPLNPIYVAVVYSLSGPGGVLGSLGIPRIPNRDLRTVPGMVGVGENAVATATTASRISVIARNASRMALPALALGYGIDMGYQVNKLWAQQRQADRDKFSSHTLLNYLTHKQGGWDLPLGFSGGFGNFLHLGGGSMPSLTPAEARVMAQFKAGKISADVAERRLRAVTSHAHFSDAGLQAQITGQAAVTVTIDPSNPKKKTVTVPVDLQGQFSTKAPQTKAKFKTFRGGN